MAIKMRRDKISWPAFASEFMASRSIKFMIKFCSLFYRLAGLSMASAHFVWINSWAIAREVSQACGDCGDDESFITKTATINMNTTIVSVSITHFDKKKSKNGKKKLRRQIWSSGVRRANKTNIYECPARNQSTTTCISAGNYFLTGIMFG